MDWISASRGPVGQDDELLVLLRRIIGSDVDDKAVLTAHPFMHRKVDVDRRFVPWTDRRRTHGSVWWAAALGHLDARHAQDEQVVVPHVADGKPGVDGRSQLNIAVVNRVLADLKASSPSDEGLTVAGRFALREL
jgi:hypothetical protein